MVLRSPASAGDFDLIASRPRYYEAFDSVEGKGAIRVAEVRLIEVKANENGGPYMNFRKEERRAILATAVRAGATAWLAHWPKRGQLRYIPSADWPTK